MHHLQNLLLIFQFAVKLIQARIILDLQDVSFFRGGKYSFRQNTKILEVIVQKPPCYFQI